MSELTAPTPRELLGDFGESYAVVRDARRELADLEAIDYTVAVDDARRRLAYLEAGLIAHADRVIDAIRAGALSDHVGDPSPAEPAPEPATAPAADENGVRYTLVGAPAGFYADRDGDTWQVREDGKAAIVRFGRSVNDAPQWAPADSSARRHRDNYAPFRPVPAPADPQARPDELDTLVDAAPGRYRDKDGDTWHVNTEGDITLPGTFDRPSYGEGVHRDYAPFTRLPDAPADPEESA
jgi:hypothetical protein